MSHPIRNTLLAATILISALLSQLNADPLASALPPAKKTPLAKFEPADGSTYHGVCLPGYWIAPEFEANLARYRKVVGERPPLVLHSWFAHCKENGKWRTWHWMNDTPDGGKCAGEARGFAELDRKHGLVPVIAWTWMDFGNEARSPRLQDVVAGKFDWYLDDWITGITEFKSPVFIRLSHEMDGDWYPYSEGWKKDPKRNTAADYIAYWKHVVDRFRKAGVTNVAWVWCVNGDRAGGKDWPDYYPGDAYVDWLAIDLYSARNPKPVMKEFLDMYGGTGKPIMIPEGGTGAEQTQWNKKFASAEAWTKELFDAIEATPRVKAICWFEWGKEWDLERDAGQAAEFRRRLQAERYGAIFERK